jgi:predicted nucleic acid-binding protein
VERGTCQRLTTRGYARLTREVISRYRDQGIGLADASIVVLAQRYRTRTIATLDHRHFDVLRSLDDGRFEVLPRTG